MTVANLTEWVARALVLALLTLTGRVVARAYNDTLERRDLWFSSAALCGLAVAAKVSEWLPLAFAVVGVAGVVVLVAAAGVLGRVGRFVDGRPARPSAGDDDAE